MKVSKLTTKEQLEKLKPKDMLLVQWAYHPATSHAFDEITMTEIYGTNQCNEVIVRKRDNLYFSIEAFLGGESCAKEVYLVEKDD